MKHGAAGTGGHANSGGPGNLGSAPRGASRAALTHEQRRLADAMAAVCVLHGQFTLRSGRTSRYYLDKYLFSTRPEILRPLGAMFAERIGVIQSETGQAVHRLAGAELGGIPLVTAASLATGLPCIFIRNSKKDYGTAKRLEGALGAGETVVIVEDVATTGGQALEAAAVVREAGGIVAAIVATIDRQEGARENVENAGIRFESLFTKADLGVAE